jgi:hypothetical protein
MGVEFFDPDTVEETPTFIEEYDMPKEVCDRCRMVWHSLPDRRDDGHIGPDGRAHVNKDIKDSEDLSLWSEDFYLISPYTDLLIEYVNQYVNKYIEGVDDMGVGFYGIKQLNIQHYKPGGGFKTWHYERTTIKNANRFLVFMTYLTDTPNAGTEFLYQNKRFECKKGKTLIWPSDFTHSHRGQISQEHEKMIATGWVILYTRGENDEQWGTVDGYAVKD